MPRADIRSWIRDACEDDAFEVCAERLDAAGAVEAAVSERPDLCLLEVWMPGSGLAAAWEIAARLPSAKVVMLAESAERRAFLSALQAGACSYLLTGMDRGRLAPALRGVLRGEAAIPRALVALLVDEFRDRGPRRRSLVPHRTGTELTSREWQVLDLLSDGLGTAEIAGRLGISSATVRSHVSGARRKLGAGDRQAAIRDFSAS